VSEWTVDTLNEHWCKVLVLMQASIDERFRAADEATQQALDSAQKAVEKAERLADIRAEVQDRMAADRAKAQNEWRESLRDMTGTYMSHAEYEAAHAVVVEKLENLSARMDKHEGRGAGSSATWVWMFVGITGVVSIITLIIDLLVEH
jgi:hypothetical protein